MYEIDKRHIIKWINSNQKQIPYHVDIACAQCHRSLVNSRLEWSDQGSYAVSVVRCAFCNEAYRLFFIDPPSSPEGMTLCRLLVVPPQTVHLDFPAKIKEISPAFINLYTQAAQAEFMRLDDLCGMGYRKALEFLIKDYLCNKAPENEQTIKAKSLGECIKDYVADPNVRDCAKMTSWLGNDETHYVRRWLDQDIADLKALLQLTVYWISSELLTSQYKMHLRKS
jgi:hypothetical protein